MTQEINLYEARLRPRREWATARTLGIATAVSLALVASLAVYFRFDAAHTAVELSSLQGELARDQTRLSALEKSLAERRVSPALAGQLAQVNARLETRQAVMDVLDSGRIGNTHGFSDFMLGFSRQTRADLWLTGFSVSAGGEEIELRGAVLDPAVLPSYVQGLAREPIFRGRQFATLTMRRVEPDPARPEASSAASAGASAAASRPIRYVEFSLRSANAVGGEDSTINGGAGAGTPQAASAATAPVAPPAKADAAGAVVPVTAASLLNAVNAAGVPVTTAGAPATTGGRQ
ncbi:PilN domain-containing protein [Rhodocyclus tenuis]|uniref:MSHA biogenesis protein MshI n=2 Tax=Rhodocyclus TaxID=1064 RepID=A0A6L5JTG3_RHOTE|nr:hypothetical protein [Rhodocyclus gracilis]MQY50685.1 hypothetical protein [Rhodocyclus gracilis]NJA88215.1 PilN domain-containing protein [Rhodocyclus gracilis]